MADAATEPASAGGSRQQDDDVSLVGLRHNNHSNQNDSACEDDCPVCNESVTEDGHSKYVECSCCKHTYQEYCTGLKAMSD